MTCLPTVSPMVIVKNWAARTDDLERSPRTRNWVRCSNGNVAPNDGQYIGEIIKYKTKSNYAHASNVGKVI